MSVLGSTTPFEFYISIIYAKQKSSLHFTMADLLRVNFLEKNQKKVHEIVSYVVNSRALLGGAPICYV